MKSIQKIKEEINKEYNIFEKKVKSSREEIEKIQKDKIQKQFKKNHGIIFKKSYGKGYVVFKILKLIKGRKLQYKKIIIEDMEDFSLNYIKERNTVSNKEFKEICEGCLE